MTALVLVLAAVVYLAIGVVYASWLFPHEGEEADACLAVFFWMPLAIPDAMEWVFDKLGRVVQRVGRRLWGTK